MNGECISIRDPLILLLQYEIRRADSTSCSQNNDEQVKKKLNSCSTGWSVNGYQMFPYNETVNITTTIKNEDLF